MSANEKAFHAAVAASEGEKQNAVSQLDGGDGYDARLRACEADHWRRCVALADKFGVSAPVYSDALRFHARGV